MAIAVSPASAPGCQAGGIHLASTNQASAAPADPHVPGPGINRPAPKKVATTVAQRGAVASARRSDISVGSLAVISFFISGVAKILYFCVVGILHWRRDNVLSAGPLAQINQPATFAAEREVFSSLRHRLSANRTLQLDLGFARHKSIVDGKPWRKEDAIKTGRWVALSKAARLTYRPGWEEH